MTSGLASESLGSGATGGTAFRRLFEELCLSDRAVFEFCRLLARYQEKSGPRPGFAPLDARYTVPLAELESPSKGESRRLLGASAIVVLNGGLGTTLGANGPKALVEARNGMSFLEIRARQMRALEAEYGLRVPWLLMHSENTRVPCLSALDALEERLGPIAPAGLPRDFLQHRFPRIVEGSGLPLSVDHCEISAEQRFAPAGHGNVFLAMHEAGLLELLERQGIRWLFLSNVDNLGARWDPRIALHAEGQGLDVVLEVTPKTAVDEKGGPIVWQGGRAVLFERSQATPDQLDILDDVRRFGDFNTNNLWVRVSALKEKLEKFELELQPIFNRKVVAGTRVVQLETAMGAVVGSFARVGLVRVDRSRFIPTKGAEDLLRLRSDLFRLHEDGTVEPSSTRALPRVKLEPRYFRTLPELERRFRGPVGLSDCDALELSGDVHFEGAVTFAGHVLLAHRGPHPLTIEAGARLEGEGRTKMLEDRGPTTRGRNA